MSDSPYGSPLILVVDDHVDTVDSLARVLRDTGYVVLEALDGKTALRLAGSHLPHVVLLDIAMPEMTGLEVAKGIRAIPGMKTALLITITGHGQPRDRQRSLEAGCDFHLVKPVDPNMLFSLLTKHLGAPKVGE